jgi:uncharacterized protein Yka (UPF0111/DUF47 family)
VGRTLRKEARESDEPNLRAKLLDSWATMIAEGSRIDVPKEKFQSLFHLLASLTDFGKEADHMITTLKKLSLRSEIAEMMATSHMFKLAEKACDKLYDMLEHMPASQSYWNVLPTVYVE